MNHEVWHSRHPTSPGAQPAPGKAPPNEPSTDCWCSKAPFCVQQWQSWKIVLTCFDPFGEQTWQLNTS